MKKYGLLVLALCAGSVAAKDWQVDFGKSRIGFVIKQMNVPVEGSFGRYSVKATFDPAKPELGLFRVDLDVASIDTGSAEGNDEAKRPAWFDTARYPKASFVSRSIRRDDAGIYTASGDFTLKGRTQSMTVPFILTPQRNGGWLASGRVALKRSQFDIGGGEWADPSVVADDLEARFKILLNP